MIGISGLPGVLRPLPGGGYNAEIVAGSVATQYAVPAWIPVGGLVFAAPLVGAQFDDPKLVLPFVNAIIPVGPAPLLFVTTYAVSVTDVPFGTVVKLLPTPTVVAAFAIVTDKAPLELP